MMTSTAGDSRASYIIYVAQFKMKMWGPLFQTKGKSAINGIKIESFFLSSVVFLSSSHGIFKNLLFNDLSEEKLKLKIISMNFTIYHLFLYCAMPFF